MVADNRRTLFTDRRGFLDSSSRRIRKIREKGEKLRTKVARLVSGAYLRVLRVGRWCNYISRYGGVFGFALYERKFRNYSTADVQTFLRALARSPVVTWETDLATLQRGRRVSHRGRRVSHRRISSSYFTFIAPLANISSRSPKVRSQIRRLRISGVARIISKLRNATRGQPARHIGICA